MSIHIKTIFLVFLLIGSIESMGAGFQQPMDALAKGPALEINPLALPAEPAEKPITASVVPVKDSTAITVDIDTRFKASVNRLKQQAASLEKYIKANNYNTEYVFLVDMSLPSGKNRFFVYNLKKETLELSSLVSHGYGSNKYDNDDPLQFSNMPYSFKTSLGRYKIGGSYYGRFGLAYKLYGLDSTNDKAFERAIVLHGYDKVPEAETFPEKIAVSAGCPAVTPSFMATLDKYIRASKKPILLWIYN